MKRSILLIIASAMLLTIILSGCGSISITATTTSVTVTDTAMPTITITTTPDLCAPENVKAEVDKVHRHMREFDDASRLAASMPREQLSTPIADLQRIRRDAEDEQVPPCLAKLKEYEVQHMNLVINTLIAFISINDPLAVDCVDVVDNTQEAEICQSIASARQQHDQYVLELARILELPIVTPAPAPTITTSETATP
jgi:hypothetical protein